MPLNSTFAAGSKRALIGAGGDGLFSFTTHTFTPSKVGPAGSGSFYNPNYLGALGQSIYVPKSGVYRFKAVGMYHPNFGAGARVVQGDYALLKQDLLMIVCGNLYTAGGYNGPGGDMTGVAVYRTTSGVWGNWEPICVSGGFGGNTPGLGGISNSNSSPSSSGAGGVDGDGGAGWLTRSYPRHGGTRGYPFIEGYGGGGAIGFDGDGDGATGGGGGYQAGGGSTSTGSPGTSCINVNCTNQSTSGQEVTSTPYVTMTYLNP